VTHQAEVEQAVPCLSHGLTRAVVKAVAEPDFQVTVPCFVVTRDVYLVAADCVLVDGVPRFLRKTE
jgi:hypothetical protein